MLSCLLFTLNIKWTKRNPFGFLLFVWILFSVKFSLLNLFPLLFLRFIETAKLLNNLVVISWNPTNWRDKYEQFATFWVFCCIEFWKKSVNKVYFYNSVWKVSFPLENLTHSLLLLQDLLLTDYFQYFVVKLFWGLKLKSNEFLKFKNSQLSIFFLEKWFAVNNDFGLVHQINLVDIEIFVIKPFIRDEI